MSTMFGFKKYISAIDILTDFKKTVDIILCQQSEAYRKISLILYKKSLVSKTKLTNGGHLGIRTLDPLIKSQLLCQLS